MNPCIHWTGTLTPAGYPRHIDTDGTTWNAQRLALENVTPAPSGRPYRCRATCGETTCINPEHLTWEPTGTHRNNN